MGLFDITWAQLASDILPPSKRTDENKAMFEGLTSDMKRRHDYFLAYKYGADVHLGSTVWAAGTYSYLEVVIYLPTGAVYECVTTSTTAEPSTSSDWLKVLDSFIGVDESQYYDGSLISLVWALNRRYIKTFVFYPDVNTSAIYLETIPDGLSMFQVGGNEANSSGVYANTATEFITAEDTLTYNSSFIVKVPAALYGTLGATIAEQEASVRNFVDKYITKGIFYDVGDY